MSPREQVGMQSRGGFDLPSFLKKQGIFTFTIALIGIAAVLSPSFRSAQNLQNVLISATPLAMVVLGQAVVIIVRGLDLSVSSVMATAAIISTQFGTSNAFAPQILVFAVVLGIVVGLINGYLVTYRRVSPFLATLATMIVLQGVRFAWTKGAPAGGVPPVFRTLGTGMVYGVPLNLIVVLVFAAVLWIVLARTSFGRKVYIVGGNPRAADLIGIRSDWITIACYVICSVLAAIAGLLLVGYVGSVDNFVGRGYELDSIVACVIGGISLSGGRGSVITALLGALIITVVFNLVLILGFSVQAQLIVKGVVIVAASALYAANKQARG